MFKKAANVAFKGETRLRGKETKKLREAVVRLGGEAGAAKLLPAKADVVLRKAGGGSTVVFVFVDGECMLLQPDGRADIGDAELVPTLAALWSVGVAALLPCVLIQRPVAKFIFGGANVMAPGIHSISLMSGTEALPKVGALVAVRAVGNLSACAVGRLKLSPESLVGKGVKGEAVEVLHYFGDALWEACGRPRPEGFVGEEIHPTAEGKVDTEGRDAQQAVETSGAQAPGTEASNLEAGTHGAETAAAPGTPSEEQEAITPEAMTTSMEQCFLQAAKTRVKDKDLPMPGNTLYAQHLRPCRKAGSNIDVKATGFKKLGPFLAHLEELGWLAMKKNSPEPVVTKIFRDHPELLEWKPWPRSITAEAVEAGTAPEGSAGSNSTPSVGIEVEPVWRVKKLEALMDALGAQAPTIPEDGCWTPVEYTAALKAYVDSRELWLKNNRKRIGADSLLLGLIGGGGQDNDLMPSGSSGFPLDGLVSRVIASQPACHRVTAPQKGAAGGKKTTVRPGKPPVVQVRTDTRRGHAVTLVHGLEAYGVDMEAFAACLQKALASSATVEEASPQGQAGVMVQGFWDNAVAEWLGKIGIPTESIQQQAKKGQQQKKAKQATNIVKA